MLGNGFDSKSFPAPAPSRDLICSSRSIAVGERPSRNTSFHPARTRMNILIPIQYKLYHPSHVFFYRFLTDPRLNVGPRSSDSRLHPRRFLLPLHSHDRSQSFARCCITHRSVSTGSQSTGDTSELHGYPYSRSHSCAAHRRRA